VTRELTPQSPAEPRVEIGAWFSAAWAALAPAWLEVVLAVLVAEATLLLAALFCYVPVIVVSGPILGGIYIYLAKRLLGLPAQVGDVFLGFRHFGQTVLLSLAIFLVPVLAMGFLLLPAFLALLGWNPASAHAAEGAGIVSGLGCLGCGAWLLLIAAYPVIVGTFAIFAYPLVLFRNMTAAQALRESFRRTRQHALNFFLLLLSTLLLLVLAEIVGTILACLGALVTVPFATALVLTMHLLAFREFVGLTAADLEPYS